MGHDIYLKTVFMRTYWKASLEITMIGYNLENLKTENYTESTQLHRR